VAFWDHHRHIKDITSLEPAQEFKHITFHAETSCGPSHTLFLAPHYPAPERNLNSAHWTQEALSLSALPEADAHPTLLFYIYGDQSRDFSAKLSSFGSDEKARFEFLSDFFKPYYTRMRGYDASKPECQPAGILATNWLSDELAGNGSYTVFLAEGAENRGRGRKSSAATSRSVSRTNTLAVDSSNTNGSPDRKRSSTSASPRRYRFDSVSSANAPSQTDLEQAHNDITGARAIEVLRAGCPERRIWFAGEHTAPFVALGTVTGAYWSGEGVARRIGHVYSVGDGKDIRAVEDLISGMLQLNRPDAESGTSSSPGRDSNLSGNTDASATARSASTIRADSFVEQHRFADVEGVGQGKGHKKMPSTA
jgi:hypothetical protein